MSLSNCVRCGKLFAQIRKSDMACNDCFDLHETEFQHCKDYLRNHPSASLKELSENTGITLQRLASWISEGRIQVM
jgi:hypothetical protein